MFLIKPVFAGGIYETIQDSDKVFLYITAKSCGYCVKFNPIYNKLVSSYGNKSLKFVKVDAYSSEGHSLARNFGAYYLPYVIMIDNKKHVVTNVTPDCLLDYACVNNATSKFLSKE